MQILFEFPFKILKLQLDIITFLIAFLVSRKVVIDVKQFKYLSFPVHILNDTIADTETTAQSQR